jgi:hypothetical protein
MQVSSVDFHPSQIPAAASGTTQGQPGSPEQILANATTTFRRLLNFRRPYDALRLQYFQKYMSKKNSTYFPDNVTKRSNTTVPYAWSNVEEINARVQDAFFQIEPWLEVRARNVMAANSSEAMETLLSLYAPEGGVPEDF